MTRKKLDKARPDDMATVTVLISFDGLYKGDVVRTEYDARVQAWEKLGLVRSELDDVPSKARPSSAEQNDQGSISVGTGRSGTSGDEPGEGFGAGRYGAAESVNPD